jgi:hypothetical protein
MKAHTAHAVVLVPTSALQMLRRGHTFVLTIVYTQVTCVLVQVR